MKTNRIMLQLLAVLSAATLFATAACGQPAPRINPANGMPMSDADAAELTPWTAIQDASQIDAQMRTLIFNGHYNDALELCLTYHEKYKTGGNLSLFLSDWVELGRRYPKARAALLEIRDHDAKEFSAGRGFADLFSEVNAINSALNQDDATYLLFKSFRDKEPQLAQQCFGHVEGLLLAKGDYQWCYDHIGDPQATFDSFRQTMTMQLDNQKRMAAMNEATQQRMAEMNRQHGLTNLPAYSPPDPSAMLKHSTQDGFIGQTRQLIEILVATGHKPDAEKIRDQAVTILDDEHLKSAVADAEAKAKKTM